MPEIDPQRREVLERLDATVDGHLRSLHRDDGRVFDLLDCSVGRILRRNGSRHPDGVIEFRPDMLAHIRDWLVAADRNDAFWLSRIDAEGRPLKLMKLGSIEACHAEADKAMRLEAARVLPVDFGPDDEAFEYDCGDGFAIVRLLSERALDLESSRMGHCIGNGAYDDMLQWRDHAFLSLRGPNGRPHATLELHKESPGWMFVQIQGRGNGEIAGDHARRVVDFAVEYRLPVPEFLRKNLWIDADRARPAREVASLPPGSTIRGSVHLEGGGPLALPEDLTIEEDLFLDGDCVSSLPRGLHVKGDLRLLYCERLFELPDDLRVEGEFLVNGGSIRLMRIPAEAKSATVVGKGDEGIPEAARKAGGDLAPRRVVVSGALSGNLTLNSIGIVEIEAGSSCRKLNVGTCLELRMGRGVRIEGDFELVQISSFVIPDGLHVEGSFYNWSGPISRIPPDMHVGGMFMTRNAGGDIRIPDGWNPGGSLHVEDAGDVRLPDGLRVTGAFRLLSSRVRRLPARLKVDGDLGLSDLPDLTILPSDIVVGGALTIEKTPVTELPDGLVVGSGLRLVETGLTRLPRRLWVGGDLDVGFSLGPIPEDAWILGRTRRIVDDVAYRGTVADYDRSAIRSLFVGRGRNPNEDLVHRARQHVGRVVRSSTVSAAKVSPFRFVARNLAIALFFRGHRENSRAYGGSVVDAQGTMHACGRMPDGVVVEGDLECHGESSQLGTNATVTGSLRLVDIVYDKLPDGLTVRGDLVVTGRGAIDSPALVLGGRIRVDGDILFEHLTLEGSDQNARLETGGRATLRGCLNSKGAVPEIVVAGRLDVSRSPDLVLAEGTTADGGIRKRPSLPFRILGWLPELDLDAIAERLWKSAIPEREAEIDEDGLVDLRNEARPPARRRDRR